MPSVAKQNRKEITRMQANILVDTSWHDAYDEFIDFFQFYFICFFGWGTRVVHIQIVVIVYFEL